MITTENTVKEMFDASKPDADGQTSLRLFMFDNGTKVAMCFNGPEAELLSIQFVQYAEALFNALEDAREKQEEGPKLAIPGGGA